MTKNEPHKRFIGKDNHKGNVKVLPHKNGLSTTRKNKIIIELIKYFEHYGFKVTCHTRQKDFKKMTYFRLQENTTTLNIYSIGEFFDTYKNHLQTMQ